MENELYIYHHGIKGMKWGIRRFQNKDGSLTSAGKKRYGMTKKQVKRAIRKSGNENRTRVSEKAANELDSSARFTKASKKATEIAKRLNEKYSEKDYSSIRALSHVADSESQKIGEKYAKEFQTALLKDIGYNNVKLGIEMLKSYGIEPTVYDPLLTIQDKKQYIYYWNLD